MMPRAGALRDRVAFQCASYTDDGGGGGAETWTTQTTVSCKLQLQRGGEALEAGRLEDTASGLLWVRKSSETEAVQANWRAVITRRGGDTLTCAIISKPLDPFGDNAWLRMNVQAGVAT